jgi:hypothetical protein
MRWKQLQIQRSYPRSRPEPPSKMLETSLALLLRSMRSPSCVLQGACGRDRVPYSAYTWKITFASSPTYEDLLHGVFQKTNEYQVLVVINSILLLRTVPYTFGLNPGAFFLSDAQVAFKYAIIAQPLWAWSMVAIKISLALMLLRIEQILGWRRFLWAMIFLQLTIGVYNTIGILLQCIPIHKAWDLIGAVPGSCWSKEAQSTSAIVVAIFNVITDFIFVALPINFLRKIRRPVRERAIVGVLMGFGVFAGVASIFKMTAAAQIGRTGDTINESINIGMWSVIEELVGFIVMCAPCLGSPAQRAAQTFKGLTTRIRHYRRTHSFGKSHNVDDQTKERVRSRSRLSMMMGRANDSGFRLSSLRTDRSDEGALWENPVKRPCEIWCTKEVVVDHDRLSRMPSCEWPNAGSNAVWMDHSFSLQDIEAGRAL